MIADPPLLAGAVHRTVAEALPAVAVPIAGAPGASTAAGVTVFDTAESAPWPTALIARTRKVYAVPLVSPVTARAVAVAGATRAAPWTTPFTRTSTWYPVIGEPPVAAGAVHRTVAEALPPVAVPIVGAAGTVAGTAGVTVFDAADGAPAPTALTAWTRKLYAVPLVRVGTTVWVAVAAMPVTVRTTAVPVRTSTW